ncbi:hypothetical protein L596_017627 [Steinernema carpocapsae]|uniref:Uncharacterized protein n=1 Tax=Steinernema carpocapsae TaxID=34508 RepID=A0A4U5N315_STECR|nr:hypothetical protein L596_017627 [Steinernema carpocapsae]
MKKDRVCHERMSELIDYAEERATTIQFVPVKLEILELFNPIRMWRKRELSVPDVLLQWIPNVVDGTDAIWVRKGGQDKFMVEDGTVG